MNKLAIVGHVKFEHTNWRGENHTYDGAIESVEFHAEYNEVAQSTTPEEIEPEWLMHVNVSLRDGEVRPRRRSFRMSDMRNVELRFAA